MCLFYYTWNTSEIIKLKKSFGEQKYIIENY